eukprot:4725399-Prymnesium_polylepis.1
MCAKFVSDLSGKCSHVVFVDDDRGNYPVTGTGYNATSAQPRDAWELVAGEGAPLATMIAWPAGEDEGGSGLDSQAMRGIVALVAGA